MKKKRIFNAGWRNSISPTCQEDITINLSRVTSLQNRPCTCWKGKKRKGKSHLMPIRFLLLAGKRCQSPSPGFGKLWGSHAFPWQRFCETTGTLVRIKQVLGSCRDFSWSDRRQGFSTWTDLWSLVYDLFYCFGWFYDQKREGWFSSGFYVFPQEQLKHFLDQEWKKTFKTVSLYRQHKIKVTVNREG